MLPLYLHVNQKSDYDMMMICHISMYHYTKYKPNPSCGLENIKNFTLCGRRLGGGGGWGAGGYQHQRVQAVPTAAQQVIT